MPEYRTRLSIPVIKATCGDAMPEGWSMSPKACWNQSQEYPLTPAWLSDPQASMCQSPISAYFDPVFFGLPQPSTDACAPTFRTGASFRQGSDHFGNRRPGADCSALPQAGVSLGTLVLHTPASDCKPTVGNQGVMTATPESTGHFSVGMQFVGAAGVDAVSATNFMWLNEPTAPTKTSANQGGLPPTPAAVFIDLSHLREKVVFGMNTPISADSGCSSANTIHIGHGCTQ